MSSYARFEVGGFELFESRGGPDPDALMVFREADKEVARFTVPPGEDPDFHPEWTVRYAAPASVVRDRLELFGFSLAESKRQFEEAREEELERWRGYQADPVWIGESMQSQVEEELALLTELTFESWCNAFAVVLRYKRRRLMRGDSAWEAAAPVERRVLGSQPGGFFGYPGYDPRPFLRVVCELVPPSTSLVYDLTDLLTGGYIDLDEDLTVWSLQGSPETAFFGNGIIVLTEGKSDQRLLQRAMRLLVPHVEPYFTFVDFDLLKVEGGAGRLVHALKLFCGAGVANQLVALFDNDTAAASALLSLEGIPLPQNVRVLQYPDLDIGRDYPTLGPHGLINADVNGVAAGLEMYFGRDVLVDAEGNLTPVQWRGFDDRLGRYQGELLRKGELQKRFEAKLEDCESKRERIARYDWSGVRSIIDMLLVAFHSGR